MSALCVACDSMLGRIRAASLAGDFCLSRISTTGRMHVELKS